MIIKYNCIVFSFIYGFVENEITEKNHLQSLFLMEKKYKCFFPRELNFTIFFQVGGIFLAVFNFHNPEF